MIHTRAAVCALALTTIATGAYADQPMTGKMAKYTIAGRILSNRVCDNDRFYLDEARRLQSLAFDQVGKKLGAFEQGQETGIDMPESACEQLYIDAGNWSMLRPGQPSEAVAKQIKLLAAIDNNNCNWDDAAKADFDPPKYPAMVQASKTRLVDKEIHSVGYDRLIELQSLYGFETTMAYVDAGNSYGVSDNMTEICPIIEEFAKSLLGQ
ncbi:MAG: hypothetical protein E5Y31_01070 [Mesorhizobium sp.]|nr:MAG: hypothetical protein E5Y31_01070 [Mesorhizobium sp.]